MINGYIKSNLPTVCLIDILGLTYDGSTLEKFGLGGSESAVIYMARELRKLNFSVSVFNNCIDSRAKPGMYEGVQYYDLAELNKPNSFTFDIMIASRTIIPFLPDQHWKSFNYPHPTNPFTEMKVAAKLKILWMHDTFCSGDHLVEELLMNRDIDEVFTLSDFHTAYITNCAHGRRRNFEVLKNKVFMTRNGAHKYIPEVDVLTKDRNLFVYNASVTKGLIPLLDVIWPAIRQNVPDARLKVIGGYYRFRDNAAPDAQEVKLREYEKDEKLKSLGVEFSGIIPQQEIAAILAKASFMLFPGAFPETFGISTLESLLYNTPVVATRFGALEETAVDLACYKIDYAIEPNVLFQDINRDEQCHKFVITVLRAYQNTYLHSQKMQYCNIIQDIAEWETVALQWKQHFYKRLGLFLPVDEYRRVMKVNQKVHEVYGRRFSNQEEWAGVKTVPEQPLTVITPFYNAEAYIRNYILSVASQDYDNYIVYLINDASTDNSNQVVHDILGSLPAAIRNRFKYSIRGENHGAVENQVWAIRETLPESIIMLLDGDDWLVNDNSIFQYYNTIYDGSTDFTYGSCWSLVDNIPLIAQPYPLAVRKAKRYRHHRFVWNMPYTHLRTFRRSLFNDIPDSVFQDKRGKWFRAGGDTAIFYEVLERADPMKVKALQRIVYNYNDTNPLNDYKVNSEEQTCTANRVLGLVQPLTDKQIAKSVLEDGPYGRFGLPPIDLREKS